MDELDETEELNKRPRGDSAEAECERKGSVQQTRPVGLPLQQRIMLIGPVEVLQQRWSLVTTRIIINNSRMLLHHHSIVCERGWSPALRQNHVATNTSARILVATKPDLVRERKDVTLEDLLEIDLVVSQIAILETRVKLVILASP